MILLVELPWCHRIYAPRCRGCVGDKRSCRPVRQSHCQAVAELGTLRKTRLLYQFAIEIAFFWPNLTKSVLFHFSCAYFLSGKESTAFNRLALHMEHVNCTSSVVLTLLWSKSCCFASCCDSGRIWKRKMLSWKPSAVCKFFFELLKVFWTSVNLSNFNLALLRLLSKPRSMWLSLKSTLLLDDTQ